MTQRFQGSSDWADPNSSKFKPSLSSQYPSAPRMDDRRDIPIAYGTPMPMPYGYPAVAEASRAPPPTIVQLTDSARRLLKEQGFTNGLIESLEMNKRAFPVTFWVVDNSGSMAKDDGHRIVTLKNGCYRFADCTRWREMQETVDYHSQLVALLRSPTTFRLLNNPGALAGPQIFTVGHDGSSPSALDRELAIAQSVMMNAQPSGVTPLAEHIQEIRTMILTDPSLQQILSNGSKIVIVLATDGLPTDARGYSNSYVQQQFVDALRSLEGLPVWIVIRLCTDEDNVVKYWNELDGSLELSLEVLDDFAAEAQEVYDTNPWLNYCLPLHRMREMGFWNKLFDLLDERALSKSELKEFMKLLFGSDAVVEMVPDPEDDWNEFCGSIATLLAKEKKQWNPLSKRLEPWIDVKQLKRKYGPKGLFGMW